MSFKIDSKLKILEDMVTCQLLENVRHSKSFYFIAGAGSGKTHALISCVKEFIRLRHTELSANDQKALCITYTNNAVNEIKERIGETELVNVCTIHSLLWDIINIHMNELLEEHLIHLIDEVARIDSDIYDSEAPSPSLKKLRDLGRTELNNIIDIISTSESEFYDAYYSNAEVFWNFLFEKLNGHSNITLGKNHKDVGKTFSKLIKLRKLNKCINEIKNKNPDYQEVRYFTKKNIEILHKNIIGHGTVLTYSCNMLKKYPLLLQKVIDNYPLILIDEFQDSTNAILQSFIDLLEYAALTKREFCLGFFGDPMQAIYNNEKHNINTKIEVIGKSINRRSHQNIVSFINNIRGTNDLIHQAPINIHQKKCDVIFSTEKESDYNYNAVIQKINEYKSKWSISINNKLACLVLKNNMLSQLCGFDSLYELMYELYCLEYQKGFERISTEFLFNEKNNAGSLPSLLYEMIYPLYIIKCKPTSSLDEVFGQTVAQHLDLNELMESVIFLHKLNYTTLHSYVCDFLQKKESLPSPTPIFLKAIESVVNFKSENLYLIIDEIYKKCSFKKGEKTKGILVKLFETDLNVFFSWLDFVLQNNKNREIIFMTCHASKGLEFDNVIVFLDDQFNKRKNYMSNLFNSNLNLTLDDDIESARRLFYVSCSRAIKNLSVILYTDNIVQNIVK